MKGRCTWNKFLNRTTQHWGRPDQLACDTFCSSREKTRHTGDFPRFHFETVHKLFSITVIPLFSHRPLIVVNVMIPLKLNLSTYYVRQNPSRSAYFSSPPLPPKLSCERKSSCLSSDFRLPSLLRLFSQAQIPTLIGESWSQKLVQKWQKKSIQRYWLFNFECKRCQLLLIAVHFRNWSYSATGCKVC